MRVVCAGRARGGGALSMHLSFTATLLIASFSFFWRIVNTITTLSTKKWTPLQVDMDASCCAMCAKHRGCEFWVRDTTGSASCWLMRGFSKMVEKEGNKKGIYLVEKEGR